MRKAKSVVPTRPNKPNWSLDCSRLRAVECRGLLDSDQAYVDRERGWVIQAYKSGMEGCDGTPWEGTLRVSVKHTNARTPRENEKRSSGIPITWDELQAIKDHFWPGQIAMEIYPPHNCIVDVAEMRWLWVLPPGAVLPFNLQGGEKTLRSHSVAVPTK